jgi:nitrate reductase gamma subunit
MEHSLLHTVEMVHWVALVFMATVYMIRLYWMFSFNPGKDRQAPGERDGNTTLKPALYSLANVAMPWAMESTRKDFMFWVNFVVFHVCAVSGISFAILSGISPLKSIMELKVVGLYFLAIFAVGFLVSVYRIIRRVSSPVLRLVSSPDDYFAILTLTVWFALGVPAAAHILGWVQTENSMVAFLIATSFFLIYVPFSKISHYLYYPFTRYFIGKTLGHRGSLPVTASKG